MDNKLNVATKLERRVHPRISQPFLTTLRDYNGAACGQVFKIETLLENLSASGMYLRSDQRVEQGTEIHAFIQVSNAATTQEASAQLVATTGVVLRAKPQPDGMWGIAVAFKQPILEHLMQQFRRAAPEVHAVAINEAAAAPATVPIPEAFPIAQETLRVEAAQTAQAIIIGDMSSAAEETLARESQEEAAIQRAEAEARRKEEDARRLGVQEEVRKQAEEEARLRTEEAAGRKAAEELALLPAEEGAQLRATAVEREQARKVRGTALENSKPSSSNATMSDQNSAPPTIRVMDRRPTNLPRRPLPSSVRFVIYFLALSLGILMGWLASRHTSPERSVALETSTQPPTTSAPLPEEHESTSDDLTSSQSSSPKTVHVSKSGHESVFTESPSLAALTETGKREVERSARTNTTLVSQARQLKVKSEEGALKTKEKLQLERRTFENLYDKRARAIRNKDFEAVMEFYAPYYSTVLPNGQTLNYEQIRDDVRRGMKKFVSVTNMNFTIEKLTVRGNEAIVDARQDFSRKQRLRDGKTHAIVIRVLQRETWTKTAWGWKLKLVDNFRIQSMTVDGKPVRPNVLYDLSDPLYISMKQRSTRQDR